MQCAYAYVCVSILKDILMRVYIRNYSHEIKQLVACSYAYNQFCLFSVGTEKCPTLSDPDSGRVFIISNGRVAIFTCNDGFVTAGNSYLQCINGKWSSPPPMCQPS